MNKKKKTLLAVLLGILAILLVVVITLIGVYLSENAGKNEYQKQIELAKQCIAMEDYDGAISAYYAAIDLDKTQETAYLGLADVYSIRGEMNYLSYILKTGYEYTGSPEIDAKLQELNQLMLNSKDSSDGQLVYLNETILHRFALSTYAEYDAYFDADRASGNKIVSTVTGETQTGGSSTKITYINVGISMFYSENQPDGSAIPEEIHLDDLQVLFSGMGNQLTYSELGTMGLDGLQRGLQSGVGNVVTFEMFDCTVWIACDENGTIIGRNVWNCIIPLASEIASDGKNDEITAVNHTVTGMVKNATTGQGVEGVTITIYLPNGTKVAEYNTDIEGNYKFEDLAEGYYTAELSADGYVSDSVDLYVDRWNVELEEDFIISPLLSAGQIRIVLTWGATPRDLDSHCFNNNGCVYWQNRSMVIDGNVVAELDVDDIDGYGPETTTIYDTSVPFHFMVEDYLRTEGIGASGAQVKIYLDDGSNPILIDANPEAKDAWDVCTIKDGKIEVINEPADNVG